MVVDFPAPLGAEEAGDRTGVDGEVEVLDDGSVAVPLGESVCLDHAVDATEPARGRSSDRGWDVGGGVVPGYDGVTWGLRLRLGPGPRLGLCGLGAGVVSVDSV